MTKVAKMESGECVIGTTVIAQRHGSGVVRYIYDTPRGPHAIVKFGTNLLRVLPLQTLTLAPSADLDSATPPVV